MNKDKTKAIRIVTAAAKGYRDELCGKEFLLAFEDGTFREVAFRAQNFAHFTGLILRCSAIQFYERALNGRLSEKSFDFDTHGNAQRKLKVLEQLPSFFDQPLLSGVFMNSGIYIQADYFAGRNTISIGFRENSPFDVPVSLYNEDIRKLVYQSLKVLAVWEKPIGADQYETLKCSRVPEPEKLLEQFYRK